MYPSVNSLREKALSLNFLKRNAPFTRFLIPFTSVVTKQLLFMMERSSHSRNRPSNNHHPYHHHNHHGPGRARGFSPPTNRYHQSSFPPPPPLGPNPLMPPSDFPPFWPVPPPFDPHGMPHPRPGPGPMMGEPWFDRIPAPPKGFNHHPFPPPFPPDHFQGHMGARDYRGGGGGSRGGEGRGVYFNDMADPHPCLFDMDFHNGPSNSQLSNSDGMSSGGNYLLPLDHQMHTDSTKLQSTSCSPSKSHAPLRPMVEVNKAVEGGRDSVATVSVMSYNLLAQDLIRKNSYLYSDAAPELLEWDFRKTNLLKDLTDSNADILCLQEVQQDHYHSWFEPKLKELGYSSVYQCRTGSHTDGCAVFYQTKTLELIEWKGITYRQSFKVLNRDNVGIVLKFAEQQSGESKQFCVATTHLLYNPKAGEVKLAQMSCLFAELHRIATVSAGNGGLLPIVLCGDFNSTPNSPMVDFITSSFLNYSKMSAAEIAGYHYKKGQSRVIPSPLLPSSMNIGPNCMYVESESDSSDVVMTSNGVETSRGATKNHTLSEKEARQHSTSDLSRQEGGSATRGAGDFVQSQEEIGSSNGEPSKRRCIKARSARGAKARGMSYSGVRISDFPSLASGKSSLKGSPPPSSSGLQTPNAPNSPTGTSVDALTLTEDDSDMEWEREKTKENQTEDKAGLEANSAAAKGQLSRSEPRKHARSRIQGLITHPFKFTTAYPQSRLSSPSTVTTFHQSAFETVDYIFFTPPTKKRAGFHLLSRKALPSTHVLLDLGPQPHRYLSSDHLLLQACFQLVSKSSRTN